MNHKTPMVPWIAHQQYIRRFNMAWAVVMVTVFAAAWARAGTGVLAKVFLVELVAGGLLVGMANVALLLATPPVSATDEEIRAAAAAGPARLKRMVVKMDKMDKKAMG